MCRVLRRSPPRSPRFSARGSGSKHAFRRGGRGCLGCLSAFGVSSSSGSRSRLSIKSFFAFWQGCSEILREFFEPGRRQILDRSRPSLCSVVEFLGIPRLICVVFRVIPLSVFSFTGFCDFLIRSCRATYLHSWTVPGRFGQHVFSPSVSLFSLHHSGAECCLSGLHFTFSSFAATLPASTS